MKDQLSVIFIGGLSNGKIIYDYLNQKTDMLISLWLLPTQIHIKELVTPYWVMARKFRQKKYR